jgi:SAM-dependent methyltransferase
MGGMHGMAEHSRQPGIGDPAADDLTAVPEIDTSSPHASRMYDYALGGKNHFAADRAAFDVVAQRSPNVRTGLRQNRDFLGRATRYLTAEAGIRQFLDIGSGLPATNNVHEVAQETAPDSRVVYVDKDPMVLTHARALLIGDRQGRTGYIQADLRDPESILTDPVVRDILDFGQPVALMLLAVLHFLVDDDDPKAIVAALLNALPPGSYLVASHATAEHDPASIIGGQRAYTQGGIPSQARDSDVFARLAFDGLDLVPPGVVLVSEWRPDLETAAPRPLPAEVNMYGGIGRKP